MIRRKITTSGNSAAILLSQDLMGLMGLSVGDDVELDLVGSTLMVRPRSEIDQDKRVKESVDGIVRRRASLMRNLAK